MSKLKTFILRDNLVLVTSASKEVIDNVIAEDDDILFEWNMTECDEAWLKNVAKEIRRKGYKCKHYFGEQYE